MQKPRYRYRYSATDKFIGQYKGYDIWLEAKKLIWLQGQRGIPKGPFVKTRADISLTKELSLWRAAQTREAFKYAYEFLFADPSVSPNANKNKNTITKQEDIPF